MLKLIERELPQHAVDFLRALQQEIDSLPEKERAAKAKALWGSRTNNEAFETIYNVLKGMCVGKAKCNYCEHNEAADIEHVAPKSLFPDLAFVWTNYILACPKCNSRHKSNKMYVFDPEGSATSVLAEVANDGSLPKSKDLAFIHPRTDDPMQLMRLNIWEEGKIGDFFFGPCYPFGTREHIKAKNTADILDMEDGERSLHYDRFNAFQSFKSILAQYAAVIRATSFLELKEATRGYPQLDERQPLENEKQKVLQFLKDSIQDSYHPTVWQEMIRQRAALPQPIQQDFETAKELWQGH